MQPHNEWAAMFFGALIPLVTAAVIAVFADSPQRFPEEFWFALVTLFIAELALCFVGAILAALLPIKGTLTHRILVYSGMVVALAVAALVGQKAFDLEWAPIVAWGLFGHLARMFFLDPEAPLASARSEAMATDAVNLIILSLWAVVVAAIAGALLGYYARDTLAELGVTLEFSHLAWILAIYYALRAWSAAWANSSAFEERGKGYFDRPSINWLIMNLGRSGRTGES